MKLWCESCLYEDYDGAEEPCVNCLQTDNKRPTEFFPKRPLKPRTNADRIRSMSDEEMAGLFSDWVTDCDCNDFPCRNYCFPNRFDCKKNWIDWLKEEADNPDCGGEDGDGYGL